VSGNFQLDFNIATQEDLPNALALVTYAKAGSCHSSWALISRAWISRILRNTFLTSRTGLRQSR
jgi:hypothetical protein